MRHLAKLGLLLCLGLATSAIPRAASAASVDDQILARLNALEKENAALRTRVNRLEASQKSAKERRREPVVAHAITTPVALPPANSALETNKLPAVRSVEIQPMRPRPRFEVSGSLLFLQPGAGSFDHWAEVANPFPVPTPNWSTESINPKYSPAFNLGLRYMPTEADDFDLNWTHLNTTNNGSVGASATQFVGPPYSIGPPAGASFTGGTANGNLQTEYDAVNSEVGHTFCAGCPFQMRVFGGVEFARIHESLTGVFQDAVTATYHSYTSNSLFTGAGPRFGIKGQYNFGNVQLFGEAAGAGLIGVSQMGINFATASPTLLGLVPPIAINYQSLSSPNVTQVVPSFDARVGTSYTTPFSDYGLFKFELGYQVAVYFNAVNAYALTNVATSPLAGGVYLATEEQLQSNFTTQGPYFETSWLF